VGTACVNLVLFLGAWHGQQRRMLLGTEQVRWLGACAAEPVGTQSPWVRDGCRCRPAGDDGRFESFRAESCSCESWWANCRLVRSTRADSDFRLCQCRACSAIVNGPSGPDNFSMPAYESLAQTYKRFVFVVVDKATALDWVERYGIDPAQLPVVFLLKLERPIGRPISASGDRVCAGDALLLGPHIYDATDAALLYPPPKGILV